MVSQTCVNKGEKEWPIGVIGLRYFVPILFGGKGYFVYVSASSDFFLIPDALNPDAIESAKQNINAASKL